jgi:16S rRNA (guanine966-N2)-methyltransferase
MRRSMPRKRPSGNEYCNMEGLYSRRMRVIAGKFRSRVLQAPRGLETRPTSDRLRETLFNILAPRIEGAKFADLYAGSGAVGIEALSRGANFCWFAERDPKAVAAIRANVAALKLPGGYAIEDRSVGKLLNGFVKDKRAADIVFLDPPYEDGDEYRATLDFLGRNESVVAEGGIVIAEHGRKLPPAEVFGTLVRYRLLQQGDAALSFYARRSAMRDEEKEALAAD